MLIHQYERQLSIRSQRFRLDTKGMLFDMEADPGQTKPIDNPEVAKRLQRAAADWRASLPAPQENSPFTVGYPGSTTTPLPARDGVEHGHVRRSAQAPNCSYFTNWISPEDSMTWHIAVETPGDYEASISYTCPAADVGSTVELSFGGSTATGKITAPWDPNLNTNEDRVPRKGESYQKEFRELKLGEFRLDEGHGLLTLRERSARRAGRRHSAGHAHAEKREVSEHQGAFAWRVLTRAKLGRPSAALVLLHGSELMDNSVRACAMPTALSGPVFKRHAKSSCPRRAVGMAHGTNPIRHFNSDKALAGD